MSRKKPLFVLFMLSVLVVLLGANLSVFAQEGAPGRTDLPTAQAQLLANREAPVVSQGISVNRNSLEQAGVTLPDGRILVIVELQAEPASITYARSGGVEGGLTAESMRTSQQAVVAAEQSAFISSLSAGGIVAQQLSDTDTVANTVTLAIQPEQLSGLRARPDVVGVYRVQKAEQQMLNTLPYLGVPQVWSGSQGGAYQGQGVVIAMVDSGLDYTHRNFGGDGTWTTDPAARTVVGDEPNFPGSKVIGGYDYVGDYYNLGGNPSNLAPDFIPAPDPDPIDCSIVTSDLIPTFGVLPTEQAVGHGTHTAGIAAGLGVNANGTTFTGDYATIDLSTLSIGPGVAPGAQLIAMKIFGCFGYTDYSVMSAAIDDAVSGRYSGGVQADIVSMSVGGPFGFGGDDPFVDFFSRVVDNAAMAGTLSVFSAGNEGNTFFATGNPAGVGGAISVASISVGATDAGIIVTGTTADGQYAAVSSASPVTATVGPAPVYFVNDGCQTSDWTGFPANTIALVDWAEVNGAFPCGSTARQNAARNSGATLPIGILMYASVPSEFIGISCASNGPNIPCLDIQQATGLLLLNNIATALVTMDPSLVVPAPDLASTISGFSSRGPRQSDDRGGIKPDIAAPGNHTIYTAGSGTGTGAWGLGGTSMATPHVAGIAALLLSSGQYNNWTPYQLKALLMNTANNDTFFGNNITGDRVGVSRMGSGIVDTADAFNSDVIAYNFAYPELVGVNFGLVETPNDQGPISETHSVRFQNRGAFDQSYSLSFDIINDNPYAQFTVSPSVIIVPAYSSADVQVTITAATEYGDAQPYARTDSSVDIAQGTVIGTAYRHFLSEETGNLIATPGAGLVANNANGGNIPLRVPVYASIRPASNMAASDNPYIYSDAGMVGSGYVSLSGDDVYPVDTAPGEDVYSLVSAFEWTGTDELNDTFYPEPALDLQYTGVSVGDSGFGEELHFGISTAANISTLNSVQFNIYLDVNQDGFTGASDDWILWSTGLTTPAGDPTDVFFTAAGPLATGDGYLQDYVNWFSASQNTYVLENNVFNFDFYTDTLLDYDDGLGPRAILPEGDKDFNFFIETYSNDVGDTVDVTPVMTYDAGAPAIDTFYGTAAANISIDTWFFGEVDFTYDFNNLNTFPAQILLLHHQNDSTSVNYAGQAFNRAELVTLDVPIVDMSIDKTSPDITTGLPGQAFTYEFRVRNWDGGETGEGYFVDNLPAGVSYHGYTTNEPDYVTCVHTGEPVSGTVRCDFADVAPQLEEAIFVYFNMTIDPSFVGVINNTVEIFPDALDPYPYDNIDSDSITVAPLAPTPYEPVGMTPVADPLYRWQNVVGGSWYQVQVYYENLATPLLDRWYDGNLVCAGAECSVYTGALHPTGGYHWVVRAWHATGGYSAWSLPLYFTETAPTNTPTPISPVGLTSATNPTFQFTDIIGADKYYVWVDGGSGPGAGHVADAWFDDSAICDGFNCYANLGLNLTGGYYSWWVQAWSDTGGYSAWSSETQFTVTLPPATPDPVTPSGSVADAHPNFVFTSDVGASWHYVWVEGANGTVWNQWYQDSICDSFGVCTITLPFNLGTGYYTWWVQSWSDYGGYSAWSAGENFAIAIAPAAPTQVAPAGLIDSGNPAFIWNPVAGGEWYYVWVSGPTGHVADVWYPSSVCAGAFCVATPSLNLPNGSYTWWVQAWSSAGGYGAWSSAQVFSVDTTLIGSETPEVPLPEAPAPAPEEPAPEAPAEGG